MALLPVIFLGILSSVALRGSKILVTIDALELGAGSATVGILAALYAALPLVVGVYAGKVSDRIGYRHPILWGAVGMGVAQGEALLNQAPRQSARYQSPHPLPNPRYTVACGEPGTGLSASFAASLKALSGGRMIATERTRCTAGSTAGGATPFSASAFAARSRR